MNELYFSNDLSIENYNIEELRNKIAQNFINIEQNISELKEINLLYAHNLK